jgi:hypothetical protein
MGERSTTGARMKQSDGMTLRLYDRATGIWRRYWIDNAHSRGDAAEPNVGRWHGNVAAE